MTTSPSPEAWLRGPLSGISPLLMPAAHALVQAREDLERLRPVVVAVDLWKRPGGAASTGFHLRHLAGALDRLFTYARGQQLDESQRQALRREDLPSDAEVDADELLREAIASIERALVELRQTKNETLLEPRAVGQRGLPSNVLGLLFHAAEHTTRHVGQLITTVKAVSGGEAGA